MFKLFLIDKTNRTVNQKAIEIKGETLADIKAEIIKQFESYELGLIKSIMVYSLSGEFQKRYTIQMYLEGTIV